MASNAVKIALGVGCGILLAVMAMFVACTGCAAVVGHNMNRAQQEKASAMKFVKVQDFNAETSSGYITIKGRVVNLGTKPVSYVKVQVKLLDSAGNVLDTNSTYAVGGETLGPAESKTFSLMMPSNDRLDTYEYGVLND